VVVVGSSVALFVRAIRVSRDESPYPALIAASYPDLEVINSSRGSFDIEDAVRDFVPTVMVHDPDLVIMHLGINDCAPRLLPRRVWRFLYAYSSDVLLEGFRSVAVQVGRRVDAAARAPFARLLNRPWVRPARFLALLDAWLELVQKETSASVILVGIGRPTARVEHALPGISGNVEHYNAILQRATRGQEAWVRFVDVAAWMEGEELERLQPDGIHLSAAGHRRLAESIAKMLPAVPEH
jgi:lysophospholipase L1-like esterase